MKYKTLSLVLVSLVVISCNTKSEVKNIKESNQEIISSFAEIVSNAGATGSILIYDKEKDKYYSNDFEHCEKGFLPASTFKITNSIIALETGVIENDSTLLVWDKEPRRIEIWEQDLYFRDAFHFSCVPCYQEIALNIGVERMNEYLEKLSYGGMDVNNDNINLFWLEGESKISQFQQIDFLRRFYYSNLDISESTEETMKRLMVIDSNDEYTISGKTGMAVRDGNDTGWFVGYLEKENNVYFFATNLSPIRELYFNEFAKTRIDVTMQGFESLNIITCEN